MEAAVPVALLSGAELLCVVASLGIAVVGATAPARRAANALLVVGGLLLAAAHVLTATMLGEASDDTAAFLRAGAYAVVAVGLAVKGGWGSSDLSLSVVAPIGASGSASVVAAGAAVAAAVASWRSGPAVRRWLAPAFAIAAVSEALSATSADDDVAAIAVLALRALWALLVFGALAELATRSVRAKVVGAIVAAVVAIAVGASAVTGTAISEGFSDDQRERIGAVATGEVESLLDAAEGNARFSVVLADCVSQGLDCRALFERLRREAVIYTPTFRADGSVADPGRLEPAAALALGSSDAVAEVLSAGESVATLLVLPGSPSRLYAVGVSATRRSEQSPITGAVAYAATVDDARLSVDAARTGYSLTVVDPEGSVLGSSLPPAARTAVVELLDELGVVGDLAGGSDGELALTSGTGPTVQFRPLRDARGDLIAVLGVSAPSGQVLRTQQSVLRVLFATTLLIGLLAAGLALLLARRITAPIERLTVTASRIRRGDLTATADVMSSDEVGLLSRAFDAMTQSLSSSNAELRVAADEQTSLRARLETIVESMGDGLVTADSRGRVTSINRVAADILQVTEPYAVGRDLGDVLSGTTAAGRPLARTAAGVPEVGVVVRPDGTRSAVSVLSSPLRDGDGSVVVVRDTTREAQIERMKTEFLSNVSHELRTPLTPIRGYAEILRRRPDLPPDKTAEYAGSILDSSLRMSRVVDLLVDVAALEAGRVQPQPADVTATSLVAATLDRWTTRLPTLALRRRVATGLPLVHVDVEWVAKALDELVDNAAKHATGPITVEATMTDRRVRIAVRDHGPGIDAEAQRLLFTDFEQVDGSATRTVGGLGLGLSFVRRVADDFGLGLGFTSSPKGTTFWLDLPAARRRTTSPRRTPAPTRKGAR